MGAKEVAVSFDEDAIVDIIPSQTKDRVPPPKNRRPPSRSSRQQPGCDNNSDELPKQNGSDALTLPSPTAELKKKKKLRKKLLLEQLLCLEVLISLEVRIHLLAENKTFQVVKKSVLLNSKTAEQMAISQT